MRHNILIIYNSIVVSRITRTINQIADAGRTKCVRSGLPSVWVVKGPAGDGRQSGSQAMPGEPNQLLSRNISNEPLRTLPNSTREQRILETGVDKTFVRHFWKNQDVREYIRQV